VVVEPCDHPFGWEAPVNRSTWPGLPLKSGDNSHACRS